MTSGYDWERFGGTARDAVLTVIGDHYGVYGQILNEATDLVSDLGSDAIDRLEVLMMMEEFFHIRFERAAGRSIRTVGDVIALVEGALGSS